jgi:argininosuccinate synthase
MRRVVLAFDGGSETSLAIPWLLDGARDGCTATEVVAVILDVGRGAALVAVRERALALGAVRCHVIDAREEFARDHLLPALHAGTFDPGRSPQFATLAYPLLAKTLVDVARMEHAGAIAVPAGRSTDSQTIEALVRALDSSLDVLVPARMWNMSPEALAAYARAHNVDAPADASGAPAVDANVWGRTMTLDPGATLAQISEPMYVITRSPEHAPDQPADLDIEFDDGVPVRVNGIDMTLLEMFESLEIIGGTHGIGRTDVVTTGADGRQRREIAESPAAAILSAARSALGAATPSGSARLCLFKGTCTVIEGGGASLEPAAVRATSANS